MLGVDASPSREIAKGADVGASGCSSVRMSTPPNASTQLERTNCHLPGRYPSESLRPATMPNEEGDGWMYTRTLCCMILVPSGQHKEPDFKEAKGIVE